MRTVQLSQSASVVLDGSGNGTCSVGPSASGEVWSPEVVAVHCDTNTSEALARVYVGADASPRYFVGGTTWGSTGDSTGNLPSTVAVGSQVFATWTGGDPGTT